MSNLRRWTARGAIALLVLPLSACQFTGVNSAELPFSKGGGSGDYRIVVEMASVANLVPNSEVKVDEVTVGSVRKVELDGWHAKLTLGIERGTVLPSNVTATVAQKSLLGAEYVELKSPPQPSATQLKDGDTIPIDHTGRYPETEETLSAVSMLLNGGGLSQLQTITHELNQALNGHEADIKAFVAEFGRLAGDLAAQRQQIVQALDGLDHLGAAYAKGDKQITTALRDLPAGVDTLAAERVRLTHLLTSLGDLGTQVRTIADESGTNLRNDARNLAHTLDGIANAGPRDFQNALGSLTYPFPTKAVLGGFRGDYMNLFFTVDLSLKSLERDYLRGTPLAGLYSQLMGLVPGSASKPAANPLLSPLSGLTGSVGQSNGVTGTTPLPSPSGASPVMPAQPAPTGASNPLTNLLGGLLGGGR